MTTALQPSSTLRPSSQLQPSSGAVSYDGADEGTEQSFRASGMVRANLTDATTYRINGTPLETYATVLGADDGLMAPPAQPDVTVKVPGRHGVIDVGGTVGAGQITFTGTVLGVDPATGAWDPGQSYGTYLARVDELMRLFTAPRLTVTATRPDGTSRRAVGRLLGSLAPAQQPADPWFGRFKATVRIAGGFWEDLDPVIQTISGPTGTTVALDQFAAGTAPMADLILTTQTPVNNPLLIHGGRTLQWNGVIGPGQQLVINTGNWTVSPGTGSVWSPDLRQVSFGPGPAWFELDPTVAPFELTFNHTGGGTAALSIVGRRRYYNQ